MPPLPPANLCTPCGGDTEFCCPSGSQWTCEGSLSCELIPNPFDNVFEDQAYGVARVCIALEFGALSFRHQELFDALSSNVALEYVAHTPAPGHPPLGASSFVPVCTLFWVELLVLPTPEMLLTSSLLWASH